MKNLIKPICRTVSLLLMFAAFLFMIAWLSSCSTTECLTTPNKNDLRIVWCDYNTLYTVDIYGHLKEIKNVDHELYFVGDYLICLDEFRNY